MSGFVTEDSKCDGFTPHQSSPILPSFQLFPRNIKSQIWKPSHFSEVNNDHSPGQSSGTLPSSPVITEPQDSLPLDFCDYREKTVHLEGINGFESIIPPSPEYILPTSLSSNSDYPMDLLYSNTSLVSWQRPPSPVPVLPVGSLMNRTEDGNSNLIPHAAPYNINDINDPSLMHMALPGHEDLVSTTIIPASHVDETVTSGDLCSTVLDLSPNPPLNSSTFQSHNGYLPPHCITESLHPSSHNNVDLYNSSSMSMSNIYSPIISQPSFNVSQNEVHLSHCPDGLQSHIRQDNLPVSDSMYKPIDHSNNLVSMGKMDLNSHLSSAHANHDIDVLPENYAIDNSQKPINYNNFSSSKEASVDYVNHQNITEFELNEYMSHHNASTYRYRECSNANQQQGKHAYEEVELKPSLMTATNIIHQNNEGIKETLYHSNQLHESQKEFISYEFKENYCNSSKNGYYNDDTVAGQDLSINLQKPKPSHDNKINKQQTEQHIADYPKDLSAGSTSVVHQKHDQNAHWNNAPVSTDLVIQGAQTSVEGNGSMSTMTCVIEVPSTESTMCYVCFICDTALPQLTDLSLHLRNSHNLKLIVKKHIVDGDELSKPCSTEKQEKDVAKDVPASSSSKSNNAVKSSLFFCNHCYNYFVSAESFKSHQASLNKSFKCSVCKAVFNTKDDLLKHKKGHKHDEVKTGVPKNKSKEKKMSSKKKSGQKELLKCEVCSQTFNTVYTLRLHQRKHTGEKTYHCPTCSNSFRLLSTLKTHVLTHLGIRPYACEICNTKFSQKGSLRRHKAIHEKREPTKCNICGVGVLSKQNLDKHMLRHKTRFKCDVCEKEFKTQAKLDIHKVVHNGDERPFKCSECSSSFVNFKHLRHHIVRVHERDQFFTCEECKATFKRRETYIAHQEVHQGHAIYKCEHCGAKYNKLSTLRKHKSFHYKNTDKKSPKPVKTNPTKEKLVENEEKKQSVEELSCDICNKKFYRSRQLNAHRRFCNVKIEKGCKKNARSDACPTNKEESKKLLGVTSTDNAEQTNLTSENKIDQKNEVTFTMPSSFKNYKQKCDKVWKKVINTEPS